MSTDGGLSARAKCRMCKRTFTPTYVFDAPTEGGAPVSLPAPPPDVPPEPLHWTAPPPAAAVAAPPLTLPPLTEPPPAVAPPLAMPPLAAAPVVAPMVTSAPLSEPPPTVLEPDDGASGKRPGGRRRQKVVDKPVSELRPYEVALASALILAVLGGLGFLAYQLYAQPKDAPSADAVGDAERPAAVADTVPLPPVDSSIKPRPKALFGAWELRADDGRNGRLILRPDGTLTASSTSGDSPLPDYTGGWYLLAQEGDVYVIEFGREHGGLDGYRVKLMMTGPDAFTLIETVKGMTPIKDNQRFVRAAAARGP
jgi:hypothetical protein